MVLLRWDNENYNFHGLKSNSLTSVFFFFFLKDPFPLFKKKSVTHLSSGIFPATWVSIVSKQTKKHK